MNPRVLAFAPLLGASLFIGGCGGAGIDATQRQLGELRAELVRVRSDQAALTERLDNLELARGRFRADAPVAVPDTLSASNGRGDHPVLDIVHLSPAVPVAPPPESDDPDADTPRPVVRITGDKGSASSKASASSKKAATPTKKKPPAP